MDGGGDDVVILDKGWWDVDGVNRLVIVQPGCTIIGNLV